MLTFSQKITVMCFAASYATAFALELWHLYRPRPILRLVALGFGGAGLLAQVTYLIVQPVPLGSPTGSLFFLALILVVFYVGETIHHQRIVWALFVLPLVLGLIGLGVLVQGRSATQTPATLGDFWVWTHIVLLLLASVGISIGFIASVMYLVQLRRLQAKLPPSQGLLLFNLERLELMNRRAILGSFPLLTVGLLIGIILQFSKGVEDWLSLRVLSVAGLWIVFAILLYLRYRVHVRGRQLALWTMFAFVILVLALVSSHDFNQGGVP
jgi:ABC-type uncharacterized transport system permease subunit